MAAVSVSPYQVLDLDQAATAAEIRQAYQRALRARRYTRQQVTNAFNQLRNAQSRLGHDLLEPEPTPVAGRLAAVLGELDAQPVIDASSAPLPSWPSLVLPRLAGPEVLRRDVPAPDPHFPPGARLDPPTRAVVPPAEFPV